MATIIMTKIKLTLVFLLIASVTFAQKSPRKQATGQVGDVTVSIDYGAPSVKERVIWGGLEKYGKVWRAGANENTTIAFDKDVKIGNSTVPAGKYGFFIIPNESEDWVVIFNKKNDGWGAYSYDKEDDVVRLTVIRKFVDENQEMLMYEVSDKGINFAWEKARFSIPVN
jgi:hypothetical protein